ncbi:MAG: glycerol-3-phosphate dehydrogenase/oxidase, partial [Bdellovibrionales bacterium]|nr:glycerol-3-phosphate dehydrogenase/oxidase [Bdellovibrionales bacterium]
GLEAIHAIKKTMCLGLEDFFVRRTPMFLAQRGHGFQLINRISVVFSQLLGWSDQKILEEKEKLNAHLKRELGWKGH